ncbi:ABC transporter ATP-binding protein [Halobacteriales archaeon QH_10_67_22]|nr:MAG: ABC transporter ATP-binding protein [Halobacteriales archaeon QH_10_67_22]
MAAIELENVTKTFGDVTALRGVDMEVREGEVFGFLGPNGAGKTTTIDVLLDFVRPTSGTATVLGHDAQEEPRAIRQRTGVLPEGLVGLTPEEADRKAGGYSRGMKQRLVLGMALIGDPDLLILDEPSTGLDPNGARLMREIVREERDQGTTVFFSSHILGQVEAVCDRVAILQDGEVIATDTVEGLREASGAESVLTVRLASAVDGVGEAAERVDGVDSVRVNGTTVTVQGAGDVKMEVLTAIENVGGEVETFDTEEASLDELFASYTEGSR